MDNSSEVSTVRLHQHRAVQRILWLDDNHDRHSNRKTTMYLHQLDPDLEKVSTVEQLFEVLDNIEENHKFSIILISSGSLAKTFIEILENYSCVLVLFIFCYRKTNYINLQSSKLRAVCSEVFELFDQIKIFMYRDSDRLDVDILHDITDETSSEDIHTEANKKPHLRFIWNYQCYRLMMGSSNFRNVQVKQEMINAYKEKCSKITDDSLRQKYLDHIEKFSDDSIETNENSAIKWYTENSCFYRFVNEAFRKLNTCEIFRFRYMITIIFNQLTELSEIQKVQQTERFRCYRGQYLDQVLIRKIQENCGHFLSFKSFLSTSKDKQRAKTFCCRNSDRDFQPVLFKITVDPEMANEAVFADIHNISTYKQEKEILFSVGTIFRIDSVTFDELYSRYKIHLSLCNKSKFLINRYIQRTYPTQEDVETRTILFGKLYMDMGEISLALKHFLDSFEYLPDSNKKHQAIYLNNMGICYRRLKVYEDAEQCYERAIQIYQTLDDGERGLGFVYHNMGSMAFDNKKFSRAKKYALSALRLRTEKSLERAMTLDLIGQIHLQDDELPEAKGKFEEALKIRSHLLSELDSNHPDLASSYKNLGLYHLKNTDHTNAQKLLTNAANIYSRIYLSDHPSVIEVNTYLSKLKRR